MEKDRILSIESKQELFIAVDSGKNCLHLRELCQGLWGENKRLKFIELHSIKGSEHPYFHMSSCLILPIMGVFCHCRQATHEAKL